MSFDSEYLALRKKREKEKEKKKQELMRSKPYASKLISSADEIAPVKTFTPTTTDAPIKSKKDDSKKDDDERTWFKKGSGGVANTILGTVADIGEDIGTGIIGMGEKAVDALAMLGTTMGNAQMSQLSNDELAFSAVKNIGKDKKTKEKEAESIVKKYNTAQKDAKKGTTEFVKKDLYNEEAIAKKIITAPFQKATDINVEASSVLGEKSDALIQSGGQLLAMAGLQAMGVPWFLTTGATSFGAEAENALNQGATFEQATMSAAVSAGAEILTEKLSSGIKFKAPGMKSAKTLDDILVKPFLERISDDVIKKLATIGVDALGEGGEEILSGMFSNLGSALYKEEDLTDILFSKEAWQEYLEGFIGGAALGGFSSSVRAVADRNKIELSENEQKVFDKVVEDRLKEATQDGKTLSKKKEAEIRNAVLRDMLKGYIDTDTIESVLGGEEYEAYKKAKDLSDENIASGNEVIEKLKTAKDTLQAEYDTLYKMKNGEKSDEQIDRQSELKEKIADIDARIEKTQGVIKNLGEDKRLSGLKTKLGQSVYDLVKDSRLGESYNEVSRRKQSFEADLSKYDAKQQETVKKAIESGILNNTNRTHEFVDMIAKISADKGVSFDFTDNQKLKESGFAIEGKTVNGLVTKDGIKINVNSAKALNSVVGHEITHILEGTELYTELQTMLKTVAESKGEYQSRYDEIRKLYEGIENADIEKELTADLVGDYLFTDREFISRLSAEKPGVFKKIFDEIKYLCKVATAGSKEAKELEKVKKTFEELYRESKAEKNTAEGGVNTKYSLSANAESELHKALYDKNYRNEVLLRDETPSIMLSQKGVKNHKMVMNASHIRENVFTEEEARNMGLKVDGDTHYHGLGEETFLKIIDSLDNVKEAYRGTKYAKMSSRRENYFLLVSEFKDEKGNTINVPVYIEEGAICNRVYLTSNKIATVFGKDDFRDYINRQIKNKNLVRIKNKNSIFSEGGVPLTPAFESTVLNNSIPNSAENVKQKQLEIIEKVNPAPNTYNTWIRKVEDIKTLAETLEDSDWADGDEFNPDLTREMIEEAIESGEITVYSSYPIEQGVFVSPSYMEAASYSGDGNVYEKTVSIDNVAWIDPTQGMYADTAESYSLASKETTPKKHSGYAVYGEEVMLEGEAKLTGKREFTAPTRESIAEGKKKAITGAPMRTDVKTLKNEQIESDETVESINFNTVSSKLENSAAELKNLQKAKADILTKYNEKIEKAQAEYDSKKDKTTKAAQTILRRIERLKRLRQDLDLEYSRRINDVETRMGKLHARMPTKAKEKANDIISQLKGVAEKSLKEEKIALKKEYEAKKEALRKEIGDKNSFIGKKASALYEELKNLKKGVKASDELGYLLDYGYSWSEVKSTLLKVSKWPDAIINPDSAVESIVREIVESEYEDKLYELESLDTELEGKIEKLGQKAQQKFERAEDAAVERAEDREKEQILGESQLRTAEPKKNNIRAAWKGFLRSFVSKGAEVETYTLKGNNRAVEDKYKMWKDRSEAKAQYFMENGDGAGKSLKDIYDTVTQSGLEKEFDLYMKHRLNVDRMKYEKPVFSYDISSEMSAAQVKKLETKHPEFIEWAKDVYAYNQNLLQMMVEKGLLLQETADMWAKQYPNYIPIERLVDKTYKMTGKKIGISAPIKEATGGNNVMETLLKTMAHRTVQVFKAIDKNDFGIALKNSTYNNTLVEEEMKEDSMDDLSFLKDENTVKIDEGGKGAMFTVYENGKKVTFNISNDMYEALQPTSESLMLTIAPLSKTSSWHKKVLTEYNLFFTARNFPKDAQEVLLNSQHPVSTYANMPQALKEVISGKGDYITEYYKNGGSSNTYFDRSTNKFEVEKSEFKKFIGFVPSGISKINDVVEAVPRVAEYIASRKKGATIEAAMLDAARVTTDFSDGGDITKFLNRNGATFLNASVQGAAQQVRNIRRAKAEGFKGIMKLVSKYTVSGLPVLLFNALLWDDDEDYEGLSEYIKDSYYVIAKYGDGQFVRIPKGRTAAVIQKAVDQVYNLMISDDIQGSDILEAGKEIGKAFISNIAPNNPIDNNILAPVIQAATGTSWYGEDIVPARLQDVPAREQYDESVDTISKWLGENTGISPYKINYLLNQYSGFVGDIVLPAFTPEAESGNKSFIGNITAPMKDQFTADSVLKNNAPSDFFTLQDKLKVNSNSKKATAEDKLKFKYVSAVSSELSELYKMKREIQNSNLSDDTKFRQVREIQRQVNETAKKAIETYEDVNVEGKYATVNDLHYRLDDEGKWQKITEEQLEKQNKVIGILGITPSQYWSNKQENDMEALYPEKYAVLQERGVSVEEYKEKHEESAFIYTDDFSWAADNPESYTLSKAVTDNLAEYRQYTGELYNIRADKDADGKFISGSAKEKKKAYIWSLDIDEGAKCILFRKEYPSDDSYNGDIINYLLDRDDISYEDKKTILEELDFIIDDDGRITWK